MKFFDGGIENIYIFAGNLVCYCSTLIVRVLMLPLQRFCNK